MTRKIDSSGGVSFAATCYQAAKPNRDGQVQVAIVGDTVEISAGGQIIHTHAIKHDRTREHGAPPKRLRPTVTHQRRLNAPPTWNTGTEATPEHDYRNLTSLWSSFRCREGIRRKVAI